MDAILVIAVCVVVANAIALGLRKLYVPYIISLVLAGLFFGLPQMRDMFESTNTMFYLTILSEAGLLALMFITGLHSSREMLHAEQKDSLWISIFGAILPIAIGTLAFFFAGYPLIVSFIIGICLSITSVATNAEVLIHLKSLSTKIGSVIVEAGLFDDFLGIVAFALVTFVMGHGALTDHISLIFVLAAFLVGLRFQKIIKYKATERGIWFAQHFLIPFFFIAIGLNFNFGALLFNPFLLVFMVAIALITKLAGALVAYPFASLSIPQLYLVGWAMNCRGGIELVIALIALQSGIFSVDIYSSMVAVAFITTLIFPIVISFMLHHDPKLMDR